MKRIFIGALTVLLFAGAAQAQKKESMKQGHHKGRTEMVSKLNLTTDQQAKLKSIREAQQAEMKVLHENKTLQAAQRKTAREEMFKKYAAQSKAVYTPAQLEQLEKMKAERKAKGKDGKHTGKDGKGRKHGKDFKKGGDFHKDLNLTDDQKTKMSALRADFKNQFETLRNDQSLSAEQKKEKSKELRKVQQDKMKAILTKDQIEKMKSTRKDRKPVQR
ncbi:MAG: hypothetical protein ACXWV0_02045 [Flavisolibacter sp.]